MKEYNADLSAYLILSELSKNEESGNCMEDIIAKMGVHANKLKGGTGGISFKW